MGDDGGVARALDRLAICLVVAGEMDRARPLFERSLGLSRQLGDSHGVALGLYGLAATRPPGADAEARSHADESLDILRAVGDRRAYGKTLWALADINADLGDSDTAAALFEESLTLFVEFGDRWFGGIVLESAAFLAASIGDVERAVHLLAAADAIRTALEVPLWLGFRGRHERVLAETRSVLGESGFAGAWEEGTRIPLDAAVELVAPARPEASHRCRRPDHPRGRGARARRRWPHRRGGGGTPGGQHSHRSCAPALDLPQDRRAFPQRGDALRARARIRPRRCLDAVAARS